MRSKAQLNEIYEKIVNIIDISNSLFDLAECEYKALGKWLDSKTPEYELSIYPQGSFALGTVVKPISDEDEYDLDLVCEFSDDFKWDADLLKNEITKPLLEKYNRIDTLKEKKRCWQVRYSHAKNFHMDIIPAVSRVNYISITNKVIETNDYNYIGSNPKGYIQWFNEKKKIRRQAILENYTRTNQIKTQAEIDDLKEYIFKTPLQKSIQLLKRHRDVMFQEYPDRKPISIIITTIAAELYRNEDNIYDTLENILKNAANYINSQKKLGKYFIINPSYTGNCEENFADKWEEKPYLASAFLDWVEEAKNIFINQSNDSLLDEELINLLGVSLGDKTIKKAFATNKDVIEFIEKKVEDPKYSLVSYKVRDIISSPHRQKPYWGELPKGSRVIIKAIAKLPNGDEIQLNSDGIAVDKETKIQFTAYYGGNTKGNTIRWQIVNYGENVPVNQKRGSFESNKVGQSITEECQFTGHHGVQCFVTHGNNKTLYKSDIFIVNIK